MHKLALASLALTLPLPAAAQEAEEPATPSSVVANAGAGEWISIAPEDLLVMELAPDTQGDPRQVVIQLMSPPFSQPWVANVRALAEAHWWDGTSVYRVQDNYVAQWGDATEQKPLPDGVSSPMATYESVLEVVPVQTVYAREFEAMVRRLVEESEPVSGYAVNPADPDATRPPSYADPYVDFTTFMQGWPIGHAHYPEGLAWPLHCYGYIGVARDYAPDTGTGAELFTIIGTPQRHMDRNLAVVGRVIEGMEHLSSLPRGHGELGFYAEDEEHLRTPIVSVRLASEMPDAPAFEYLASDSESFARYVEVRANRNDPFYTVPAGGVDVCSVQVPVRRVGE